MVGVVHVVGASTAGLYAAYRLARMGAETHLYEAEPFIDPAPRTLILTPYFLKVLDFPADEVIVNRVRVFELISASSSATITLKEPDLVVERRRLFDLLMRKAVEVGVNFHFGYRLEDVVKEDEGFLLNFKTKHREEKVLSFALIGADGVESLVAQRLGCKPLPTVAVVQAKVHFSRPIPAEKVQVWFDRSSTRFFLWLIPESPYEGAVGLIADEMERARKVLDDFLSSHSWEPNSFQAAFVHLYLPGIERVAQCSQHKAILVGDAAGHMKNTTVGGVVAGLRAASALRLTPAGRIILGKEWRHLKSELTLHAWLRRLLDTFSDRDYDQLLRLLNRRSLQILATHPRDEFVKALLPLILSQPRWFYIGAKAFGRWFKDFIQSPWNKAWKGKLSVPQP